MLKKNLLILFIIFSIVCICNVSLAANTANNVKNAVGTGTNTVVDGMSNLAHDVRNGVGNIENGIEDALTMDDMNTGSTDNFTNTATTTDTTGYTATRTATTGDDSGMFGIDSSTMWVWAIVAIAAIGIVGLVWFYGSQNRID